MAQLSVSSSSYRTMSQIAFQTIKEGILKGVLSPGTRLIPAKLENDLKLGRIAIREALRELTGTGLVISKPNKGIIVSNPPKMEEIKEIFEIRYLLEGKAAYLATPKITMETVKNLESLHKRMCAGKSNFDDLFDINRDFHLIIYRAAEWDYLFQVITQLIEKVQVFRSRYPSPPEHIPVFNRDHGKILSAIKDKDSERVSELIVTNIRRGMETMMSVYMQKEKSTEL